MKIYTCKHFTDRNSVSKKNNHLDCFYFTFYVPTSGIIQEPKSLKQGMLKNRRPRGNRVKRRLVDCANKLLPYNPTD